MKQQTVVGIFDYGVDAQMAAQQLEKAGIPNSKIDISVHGARDRTSASTQQPPQSSDSSGRVGNFFNSLLGNRNESAMYSEAARNGSVVTVHTSSEEESRRVCDILDKAGAIDVNERASSQQRGMSSSSKGNWTGSTASIPVVEENLNVGKREVETGGVRIRSRIIERPVEENLRLREEHVNVERRPVNRPANERDLEAFKEGEKTITERAEIPVVNKEARVVEEVRLNKETTEHTERIHDTVRKQDVEVDKLNPRNEAGTPPNPHNKPDTQNPRNRPDTPATDKDIDRP
ncbi:YsnF/AvaK domain-containing protein [Pontibacter chinhatensis]|uniref:Conserved domain-containing protein n=1 Tax=Pontibacter chinhatensis TaxID=1436961 RepID=A0A1I2MRX6_9BACT|nr:YsnF/AvaK domain-containing protein [Pontibacter chinhatensis]SFF92247.1 conserved domain-containing protein [Pontibacter chinhatensis]